MSEINQRKIYTALTGDDLRTVRECVECGGAGYLQRDNNGNCYQWDCPTCNGMGTVFREWTAECPVCVSGRDPDWPDKICPECHGDRRIPDDIGRARIAEAFETWWHSDADIKEKREWDRQRLVAYQHSGEFSNENYGDLMWFWKKRFGQPWQADLESHVRNYVAAPPNLTANDGAKLKRLLREAGYWYQVRWDGEVFMAEAITHDLWCERDTEAAALLAATWEAIQSKVE